MSAVVFIHVKAGKKVLFSAVMSFLVPCTCGNATLVMRFVDHTAVMTILRSVTWLFGSISSWERNPGKYFSALLPQREVKITSNVNTIEMLVLATMEPTIKT